MIYYTVPNIINHQRFLLYKVQIKDCNNFRQIDKNDIFLYILANNDVNTIINNMSVCLSKSYIFDYFFLRSKYARSDCMHGYKVACVIAKSISYCGNTTNIPVSIDI